MIVTVFIFNALKLSDFDSLKRYVKVMFVRVS